MKFFNIVLIIDIIFCIAEFDNIEEVFVLENNYWGVDEEQIQTDKGFLDSIFFELIGCGNSFECYSCTPLNCYYDNKNEKFYHILYPKNTDQYLSPDNYKIMKFMYTYCNVNNDNFKNCPVKKDDYYSYKVLKKAENGSIEFETDNVIARLCYIKQIIQTLFKLEYVILEKINSIKKKRFHTAFLDFQLLHFESLLECQKSFKGFVRILKCLKLVQYHSNLDKEESSSENDLYSNEKNKIENNEENSIDKKSENNTEDATTESGPFLNEDNDSLSEPSIIEKMMNYKSESSSSDEENLNIDGTMMIEGELWRKKVLFNIEEEGAIDVDSSSAEEDYTTENPNRRLSVFFLKQYLKEKFYNDHKNLKEGNENGLILYNQIKPLFNNCCNVLIYKLLSNIIILPVKGAYTLIFYLDKFYELIKKSIDELIENFDGYNFENNINLGLEYLDVFKNNLSNFYQSISGDAWEHFNIIEYFTKVIGKDIINTEDYVEVEKVLCDYHNMMSTTLRDKENRNSYRKQKLISPMLINDNERRIIRMLEVTFKHYTEISEIRAYDSNRKILLLQRNEDFFLTTDEEDGILFDVEKILAFEINEIEIIVVEEKETLKFKVKDYLNISKSN